MSRVAAVDCGTNSLRLLVADVDPAQGTLTDVDRRMEIVRLGQGVDRTGRFVPEALERTFATMRRYAEIISATGAEAMRVVATSATRDAENADEFTGGVRAILGTDPEVISGGEEAALSFAGATAELPGTGITAPYLVVDVGGGSTEFVLGRGAAESTAAKAPGEAPPAALRGGRSIAGRGRGRAGAGTGTARGAEQPLIRRAPEAVAAAVSVDIGSVRLTERHLHGDPPEPAEVAAAAADIDAALDVVAAKMGAARAATLVGLAGSITTVAAIALDLPEYDPAAVHHSRHTAAAVHAVTGRLLGSTRAERSEIGSLHPGRVDVIGAGALILDRVMTRFGFTEVVVSEHDILDGIAWRLVAPAANVPGAPGKASGSERGAEPCPLRRAPGNAEAPGKASIAASGSERGAEPCTPRRAPGEGAGT